MVSKKYMLLALFLPLLISGCTIPFIGPTFNSNTPEGTGVVIKDFGPDIQGDINSGEKVTFALRVKNTGSVTAEKGFAELIGLDYVWKAAGLRQSNLGELFPNENNCAYDIRNINLLPEDNEAGTTGEETVCTWTYTAPTVSPGIAITSTPRVRFYYTYHSTTIKTITMLSREELINLQNQGKGLPVESYTATKSPISLEIASASPVKIYGNQAEFPIIITIKNVGGGTVCYKESFNCKKPGGISENDNWNWFMLRINLPEGLTLDAASCAGDEKIYLVGSSPQTLSCKIIADVSKQVGISQKNIELAATYGYAIDKTISLNVVPSNMPGSSKK